MHKIDEVIERLRALDEEAMYHAPASTKQLADQAADLLAAMKEALEPFAKCADEIDYEDKVRSEYADEPVVTSDDEWAKFRLLVSGYRRARDALNGDNQPS